MLAAEALREDLHRPQGRFSPQTEVSAVLLALDRVNHFLCFVDLFREDVDDLRGPVDVGLGPLGDSGGLLGRHDSTIVCLTPTHEEFVTEML